MWKEHVSALKLQSQTSDWTNEQQQQEHIAIIQAECELKTIFDFLHINYQCNAGFSPNIS